MSSLLLTTLDTGNTAWMIMATILVLLMSIPGIALFYGGLVRQKNILSILMQTVFIVAAQKSSLCQQSSVLLDVSQKMLWCVILGKDYGFAAECTYLGSADVEHITAAGDDTKSHIGVVTHETIT